MRTPARLGRLALAAAVLLLAAPGAVDAQETKKKDPPPVRRSSPPPRVAPRPAPRPQVRRPQPPRAEPRRAEPPRVRTPAVERERPAPDRTPGIGHPRAPDSELGPAIGLDGRERAGGRGGIGIAPEEGDTPTLRPAPGRTVLIQALKPPRDRRDLEPPDSAGDPPPARPDRPQPPGGGFGETRLSTGLFFYLPLFMYRYDACAGFDDGFYGYAPYRGAFGRVNRYVRGSRLHPFAATRYAGHGFAYGAGYDPYFDQPCSTTFVSDAFREHDCARVVLELHDGTHRIFEVDLPFLDARNRDALRRAVAGAIEAGGISLPGADGTSVHFDSERIRDFEIRRCDD